MRESLQVLLVLAIWFAVPVSRSEVAPYQARLQDAPQSKVYERVKGAVWPVRIGDKSKCTLVARSPQVVQFAEHCLRGVTPTELLIGEHLVKVERISLDGNDHVLMRISGFTFTQWAVMASQRPKQGEWVFLYGSPMYFDDLLRMGSFAGLGQGVAIYDLSADHGDSGAPIFNSAGEILDIVWGSPKDMTWLTVAKPIQFTRSQLQWVGL